MVKATKGDAVRTKELEQFVAQALLERNRVSNEFFPLHAAQTATASREMAERFLAGGRLLAFGSGCYATDAQHISVEFIHPVIVGKKALPALDLSIAFRDWLPAILTAEDIVVGFGPPSGDGAVDEALAEAHEGGALTIALPGNGESRNDLAIPAASEDPFIHQEMIEILYHTLWETVHVFLEHRELGTDVGEAGFLYPYLGKEKQSTALALEEVAASIETKARDDTELRSSLAEGQAGRIATAVLDIGERLRDGGRLIVFGNGGSATDANDFALDCALPPKAALRPIPAVSLSMEPANISAIGNDVGIENIFRRQLIAHARPGDVAVGISTSGGSANIVAALEEARKKRLLTVALLGCEGGEIARRNLADHLLVVGTDYIPRIQEVQASVYHVMREALDRELHG